MPGVSETRISANNLRRRTEALHRAAGELGDDFLQYLFGMALLHIDERAKGAETQPVEAPAWRDLQILLAAKLVIQG